jgi:hypothetical protein
MEDFEIKIMEEETIRIEEEFKKTVASNRNLKKEIAKNIYEEAVNAFGSDLQKVIAIEELSELIKALTKEIRMKSVYKTGTYPFILNIAEEIADVEIMLSQLKIIYREECTEYGSSTFEETISNYKEDKLSQLNFVIRDFRHENNQPI